MLGSELDTRDGKCTRRVCRTPRNEISESRSIAVVSTAQRRRRKKTSIAVAFAGQYTKCEAADCSTLPRTQSQQMSGTIPPQLTADDARRVADVRRDVWTAGLRGAVAGVFIGSTGWLGARHLNLLPKAFRTPNHFSLATMGCGALVSFLSSLAAGKNSVQRIGDVFSRGAVKPDAERRPVSALQLARANAYTDDLAARRRGRAHALSHGDDEARHGFAPKPPDS